MRATTVLLVSTFFCFIRSYLQYNCVIPEVDYFIINSISRTAYFRLTPSSPPPIDVVRELLIVIGRQRHGSLSRQIATRSSSRELILELVYQLADTSKKVGTCCMCVCHVSCDTENKAPHHSYYY